MREAPSPDARTAAATHLSHTIDDSILCQSMSLTAAGSTTTTHGEKDRMTDRDHTSTTTCTPTAAAVTVAFVRAGMKRAAHALDAALSSTDKKRRLYTSNESPDPISDNDCTNAHDDYERNADAATRVRTHTDVADSTPPATTAASTFFAAAAAAHVASQPLGRSERPNTTNPAHAAAAPSSRVLSPLAAASVEQIEQHVRDVRREVFLRPLLAIITRLMFHKANHNLFNVAVDPIAWNIPHYADVIKRPMDLSLVKSKCLNLEYATAADCAADIRLVFENACLFNPPSHVVHEAAKVLAAEFVSEYARFETRMQALAAKRDAHSCSSCLANVCSICEHKCITFEPPLVVCAGPCRQRIKRHALYYSTRDRTMHWCAKCYTTLPKVLALRTACAASAGGDNSDSNASVESTTQQIPKSSLVKAKFLDELTEPWVQCDACNGWVHQVCALYNAHEDDTEALDNDNSNNTDKDDDTTLFTCPRCRVDALLRSAAQLQQQLQHTSTDSTDTEWDVVERIDSPSSETSLSEEFPLHLQHKLELMGSHSPVLKRNASAKEFTRVLGFDAVIEEKVFDYLGRDGITNSVRNTVSIQSSSAPQSPAAAAAIAPQGCVVSSTHLRSCALSTFMQKWVRSHLIGLNESAAAASIVVKVVSSIKTSCPVSPAVREHFGSTNQSYPARSEFWSKAIFVFQQIHGIEVCIFSMYVQEYDATTTLAANRNRTYIAYIDSLVYMRPRHVRTSLFHSLLIAYLASCKARGFERAHIWACPTTRGGDFIYWCHPRFQKNPGKDRLLQWYLQMADVGKRANVVFACQDLYACEFEHLEAHLETTLPPYFDGDYWPAEVERLAAHPPKRGRLSRDAYAASLQGPNFRKRIAEAVKASRESLFVIALQPTCHLCSTVIVNCACWKQATVDSSSKHIDAAVDDVYVCESCYSNMAETTANSTTAATTPPTMTHVQPPSFVAGGDAWRTDESEIQCAFLDYRGDMLKNCEVEHYQFDTFRRAKYSTMMLIYQIHAAQQQQQKQQQQ